MILRSLSNGSRRSSRIQTPNDKDLVINGMSGQKVKTPRFGSEIVNVDVTTGLSRFLLQFQEFNKSGVGRLRYRLKGTAFVESPAVSNCPSIIRREKFTLHLRLPARHRNREWWMTEQITLGAWRGASP